MRETPKSTKSGTVNPQGSSQKQERRKMEKYWAIAQSDKYPDIHVKEIKAKTQEEAVIIAKEWHKEDIGFPYNLVVTKELIRYK